MKTRILPTKPKAEEFKAVYKVQFYVRVYQDLKHPEIYEDYPVNTRTAKHKLLESLAAVAYQFYDVMTIISTKLDMEDYISAPRNFSDMKYVKVDDED